MQRNDENEFWARIKQPSGVHIILRPRQIFAIGRVIVQWSPLAHAIGFHLKMWRFTPTLPETMREQPEPRETSRQLSWLHNAAPYVLRDKPELLIDFQKNLSKITSCKGKRDWFSHGEFAGTDNRNPELITVVYKNHKIRIATGKVEALADEISLLTGWLMNFGWREHEKEHRALMEQLRAKSS